MPRAKVNIAEHLIYFQTTDEEVMTYLQSNFMVDRAEENRSEQNSPDLTVGVELGYGQPFESFLVDITQNEGIICFRRKDYQITVDDDYCFAEVCVYDLYALKHALMNLYSSFIVHRQWGLMLHASCVLDANQAYVFSGHSGAGKSTIARLSSPRPLLSDEASILKVNQDSITVYDSPFRSETLSSFEPSGYQLAAINLIHQSADIKRERVGASDGIVRLMDKVFYWAYDTNQTKSILKMYQQVVQEVPLYDLYFQKNDAFWEAIS